MFTKYEPRVRGWPAARTRRARKRWFDTSSVSSPNSVGRNYEKEIDLRFLLLVVSMSTIRTHLVAKPGVTAADVLFVGWTHGETHVSVEPHRAKLVA
jgi:hypothetical protein